MNLIKALRARYPDLMAHTDYTVFDDGTGPKIDWRRRDIPMPTQADLDAGWAAYRATSYRAERAARYKAKLGKDPQPSFENTVGDVLDTLIAQVAATAAATSSMTPDMAALVAKIAAIKAQVPK